MTAPSEAAAAEDPIASAPPGCLILAAGSHRRFGAAKLLHPLADGRPLIFHEREYRDLA